MKETSVRTGPFLVFLIHKDTEFSDKITKILNHADILVVQVRNGSHMGQLLKDAHPEVVICTMDQKVHGGEELYKHLRNMKMPPRCIFLIERSEIVRARELVLERAAYDYFVVNSLYDVKHIEITVRAAVREFRLIHETDAWQNAMEGLRSDKLNGEVNNLQSNLSQGLKGRMQTFRESIAPPDNSGPVIIRDHDAFERIYHETANGGFDDVIEQHTGNFRETIDKSIATVSHKVRNTTPVRLDERVKALPEDMVEYDNKKLNEFNFGCRVLIITKDLLRLHPYRLVLLNNGFEVVIVENHRLDEITNVGEFNIILLDVSKTEQPPKLVRQARKLFNPASRIIVLSVTITRVLIKEIKNAGADDIILLPVSQREFIARLKPGVESEVPV